MRSDGVVENAIGFSVFNDDAIVIVKEIGLDSKDNESIKRLNSSKHRNHFMSHYPGRLRKYLFDLKCRCETKLYNKIKSLQVEFDYSGATESSILDAALEP